MNQLSIIQALTGNLTGQSANGNGSQGAEAGSGAGLFASLLGQQSPDTAQGGQPTVPGVAAGLSVIAGEVSAEVSSDGASALLQTGAGAAADQTLLASAAPAAGEDAAQGTEGQVLFGLINKAENSAAIENAPVLAAALSSEADGETTTFAAGPNAQDIPAPFQGISLAPVAAGPQANSPANVESSGTIVGQLPAEASATAALASGKTKAPADIPSSSEVEIATSIAPDGEAITTAAKSMGPAEASAAPQSAPVRGDAAPVDAGKIIKTEASSQPRSPAAARSAGETQPQLQGDANSSGGSDDFDGEGEQGKAAGKKNLMAQAGSLAGGKSAHAPGIKTSMAGNLATASAAAGGQPELPGQGQLSVGLQSQITPLRAPENSMALQAGLILPFDGGAPIDPMTGMQTSLSAQSVSGGIQAMHAGTAALSPAQSASSLAHTPNFVANQVGLQITKAVADGQNEFTIRLNPPEMGRIDVRLEFQADGGVKAALSAEKPETLSLLQRDSSALERALNDAGVKTNSGSLNFSLQQGEAQAGNDHDKGAGNLAAAGEEIFEDSTPPEEIEITEQIIQQMVADGAVDIHV